MGLPVAGGSRVAYLFDTDAISELFKPRPLPSYVKWLRAVPGAEQCTSAVVVAELFAGAFRSSAKGRHLENIRQRVLPSLRILPFDETVAETYGRIRAELERSGRGLAEADLQIAATALVHGCVLVTGNVKHFARVPGLAIDWVLASGRG
ncbi:MAG TPA: type II toxin-antitoxin system VapC family toxin [Polyangiaceae bacterium]